MLLKLALRNIRRSLRDYAIYFITIVFGVAVFYAFNSIGEQRILFDLEATSTADLFDLTQAILGMFSVVIAFVLGFLVVYANRFLIRRRKREFGTYLLLGMSAGHVSRIVLYETVFVGFASLAVGLVVGIVLAQALSFVTAFLFGTVMTYYQFVFSAGAFLATLACFAFVYVVVAVFNVLTVNRFQLIDLLNAQAKNEKLRVRNPWARLVVFVASIGILAAAYWNLAENGLVMLDDPHFTWATALMLVGTFAFFWSLSGFVVIVMQRARGVYFRGLSMFTVRQIASKVSTATASLAVVCVMLFFSITVFSCGMGLVQVFTGDVEEATVFDASLRADVYYADAVSSVRPDSETYAERRDALAAEHPDVYAEYEKWDGDTIAKLSAEMPNWDDFVGGATQVDLYEVVGATYGDLAEQAGVEISTGNKDVDASVANSSIVVMSESDYNGVRTLLGRPTIDVADGTFAINNNYETTQALADAITGSGARIDVLGHELAASEQALSQQIETNMMASATLFLVVPDDVVAAMREAGGIPTASYVDIMYKSGVSRAEGDAMLDEGLAAVQPDPDNASGYNNGFSYLPALWPVSNVYTGLDMSSQMGGMRLMITYLALYIGFVFLIATAAVLAIQQLSEAADSLPRYRMLSEIGCDARMICGSLRTQVLFYFLAPLALAAAHSACAIGVMSGTLFDALGTPVYGAIALAAGLVVVVYGGYLAVTYFASRGIVRGALAR